ncbi:MAG: tetratricopeptide repeat protein [Treponematales bacterium]
MKGNKCLEEKPEASTEDFSKSGKARCEKDEWDKAIADFTAALTVKPDDHETLYNRSNAYFHKGEWNKAIADYTAALTIKPDYPNALYNRGKAYGCKGERDKAIADYNAAFAIEPFAIDKSEWNKFLEDFTAGMVAYGRAARQRGEKAGDEPK